MALQNSRLNQSAEVAVLEERVDRLGGDIKEIKQDVKGISSQVTDMIVEIRSIKNVGSIAGAVAATIVTALFSVVVPGIKYIGGIALTFVK